MNDVVIYVLICGVGLFAYMLIAGWVIRRGHNARMELAKLGSRLISQDSVLPPDEQRLVAVMLRKAYSPMPMLEVLGYFPVAVWELLFRSDAVRKRQSTSAYGRLRKRADGERITRLFSASIMMANVPATAFFVVLSGALAPLLILRGGSDRARDSAVDHIMDGNSNGGAMTV